MRGQPPPPRRRCRPSPWARGEAGGRSSRGNAAPRTPNERPTGTPCVGAQGRRFRPPRRRWAQDTRAVTYRPVAGREGSEELLPTPWATGEEVSPVAGRQQTAVNAILVLYENPKLYVEFSDTDHRAAPEGSVARCSNSEASGTGSKMSPWDPRVWGSLGVAFSAKLGSVLPAAVAVARVRDSRRIIRDRTTAAKAATSEFRESPQIYSPPPGPGRGLLAATAVIVLS